MMSVDNVARASRPTKSSPRGLSALPDSDLQSETAGAALWEQLRGGPPQSDDAVRHWLSCTRSGEVLGGLLGLEARVTLGGLGRWEGAAHDTLRGASYLTFPPELSRARIAPGVTSGCS